MGLKQEQGTEGQAPPGHFIVVGAGFGGLTAAIELKRRGFSVLLVETAPEMTTIGWAAPSLYTRRHIQKSPRLTFALQGTRFK